jgi:acetolactate synthase-1/2/3 large subunit
LAAPHVGIEQKAYRQENAGGAMADGYARISRKVGVVTAQNGPAAALLVPPLAEALKASVPVLALVQEVTRDAFDRNAFQELDHLRMFEPVAKWVRRLDRADRLDDYVDMAFTAAASGRPGPAVLLVPGRPADRGGGARLLPAAPAPPFAGRVPLDRCVADPAAVAAAAEALAAARHPLVVAGGGVHLSGAAAELAALQEAAHLPVGTTVMGKGAVDETHPLSLGVVGYVMGLGARTHALRPMVERADLGAAGGQPHQPERHGQLEAVRPGDALHPPRRRPDGGGAQLRSAAPGRRRQAHPRGADRGAPGKGPAGARRARSAVEREIAAAVAGWRDTVAGVTTRDAALAGPSASWRSWTG